MLPWRQTSSCCWLILFSAISQAAALFCRHAPPLYHEQTEVINNSNRWRWISLSIIIHNIDLLLQHATQADPIKQGNVQHWTKGHLSSCLLVANSTVHANYSVCPLCKGFVPFRVTEMLEPVLAVIEKGKGFCTYLESSPPVFTLTSTVPSLVWTTSETGLPWLHREALSRLTWVGTWIGLTVWPWH